MRSVVAVSASLALWGCATSPPAPSTLEASVETKSPAAVASPAAPDEATRFKRLLEEEWEYGLRENPTYASFLGDKRFNDQLTDVSFEAIERRKAHAREVLAKLKALDPAKLPESERLNYALFLRDYEESVEGQRFPNELFAINQMGGVHTMLPRLAQNLQPRTVKDIDDFVARLRAYPKYVEQSIARMKVGVEKGITPAQVTLKGVEAQLRAQLPANVEENPILKAGFTTRPSELTEEQWTTQRGKVVAAIREAVNPANQRLLEFWTGSYYPKARTPIALSALPDGEAWYAFNAKEMTTTTLTPEEIHQIGLSEVKRIRAQMEKVKEQVGFKGPLGAFFKMMQTDPKFFFKTEGELLMAYRDIAKRIDPQLPRLFGRLPRLPYGVQPVPDYAARNAPTAYYLQGSLEAGRAGFFFANTYDLKSRPRWEMEALTAHEAVPGHHLQLAINQELGELPNFRRHGGYTAYVEGWGLYSESLGEELGLYTDPYSKMGQLTFEMWRAIRLVVDTGMHMKGWTREQAIAFFLENAPRVKHDVEVEVDRYIVNPGQALAYKIGELQLQKLKKSAREQLGAKFDLRAFHDAVLGEGSLPLDVLETRINAWIARQQSAAPTPAPTAATAN